MRRKRQIIEDNLIGPKETLEVAKKAFKTYTRKFIISYGIFLFLNISVIFMSSFLIILNLYSLRYNQTPVQIDSPVADKMSIYLLITIAIGSASITLLTSLSAFFSFNSKREQLRMDIKTLEEKLIEFKTTPIENLNAWIEQIADYGDVI